MMLQVRQCQVYLKFTFYSDHIFLSLPLTSTKNPWLTVFSLATFCIACSVGVRSYAVTQARCVAGCAVQVSVLTLSLCAETPLPEYLLKLNNMSPRLQSRRCVNSVSVDPWLFSCSYF